VLSTGFSLIRPSDIVSDETAHARAWDGELRLLTVGRLSPEKNPLLLPEIVALLPEQWRLEAIGEGPLREAVASRAAALGVSGRLTLSGYVPNGDALWQRYREAHAFLHVSHTEGVPQVLFEAQSSGLPVVATDVGGVRDSVGATALLVPPADAEAAAAAVDRLRTDGAERRRLIDDGLAHARRETLDAQLDRVAEFVRQQLG
jgi:glycosyltransferase involved in cell wall biosynthesis